MYAIGFALETGFSLDRFLHAIFPPYPNDVVGGGDPGWMWYNEQSDGVEVIVVEIDHVVAPPEGMWNEYSIAKVRYEIRAALSNLAIKYPTRINDINRVIGLFDLGSEMKVDGCVPIPRWDGGIPAARILNA